MKKNIEERKKLNEAMHLEMIEENKLAAEQYENELIDYYLLGGYLAPVDYTLAKQKPTGRHLGLDIFDTPISAIFGEFNAGIYTTLTKGRHKDLFTPYQFFDLFYRYYSICKLDDINEIKKSNFLSSLTISKEQLDFVTGQADILLAVENRAIGCKTVDGQPKEKCQPDRQNTNYSNLKSIFLDQSKYDLCIRKLIDKNRIRSTGYGLFFSPLRGGAKYEAVTLYEALFELGLVRRIPESKLVVVLSNTFEGFVITDRTARSKKIFDRLTEYKEFLA